MIPAKKKIFDDAMIDAAKAAEASKFSKTNIFLKNLSKKIVFYAQKCSYSLLITNVSEVIQEDYSKYSIEDLEEIVKILNDQGYEVSLDTKFNENSKEIEFDHMKISWKEEYVNEIKNTDIYYISAKEALKETDSCIISILQELTKNIETAASKGCSWIEFSTEKLYPVIHTILCEKGYIINYQTDGTTLIKWIK